MDNDNIELEDRNDFNDIQLLMDKLIQDQIEYYVVYKKKLRTSTEVRTHFHWEVQGFNSFYPIFKQRLLNYLRTKKNIPLSVFKDPYTYFFKKSVLYGDIRQRVEEKGYILKTNEYDVIIRILETSNTDTITIDIECKRGHPESLSLNTFRRKGQCSYCLGESLIHNYDDYLILGQENDLILETVREDFPELLKEYLKENPMGKPSVQKSTRRSAPSESFKLEWTDSKGHTFLASFNQVKNNDASGCPICGHILKTRGHQYITHPEYAMKLGKETRIINYLHEIYRVPDTIMDNAIARASELSHKIVSDQPSKRTVFNKKRVNFFKKFINNHSLNTSLDPWLKKLVDFSSNKEDIYTNEEMESNWPSHEAVLKKILFSKEYEDNTIAIEVPIWSGSPKEGYVTGHIDLLMYNDNTFYICDYKPDLSPYIKGAGYTNFIQSIPQVATYAKMLREMLENINIKCVIFNSEGAWSFDLNLLQRITNFMKNQGINKVPWENLKFVYSLVIFF